VEIERFLWTDHAELRLGERGLTRFEVEEAVREGHELRESNPGDADWRVYGVRSGGGRFAVIYDQPVNGDDGAALIVSVWLLRGAARS
jgi:Domain of unknown function (DUF4258)